MTSTPDYRSFPRNEMGEPLMDGAAYRFEQGLDAEYDAQGEDFYERMERYEGDIADDPNYCDYHGEVHTTPCEGDPGDTDPFSDDTPQYLSATPWDPADHHPERNDC